MSQRLVDDISDVYIRAGNTITYTLKHEPSSGIMLVSYVKGSVNQKISFVYGTTATKTTDDISVAYSGDKTFTITAIVNTQMSFIMYNGDITCELTPSVCGSNRAPTIVGRGDTETLMPELVCGENAIFIPDTDCF